MRLSPSPRRGLPRDRLQRAPAPPPANPGAAGRGCGCGEGERGAGEHDRRRVPVLVARMDPRPSRRGERLRPHPLGRTAKPGTAQEALPHGQRLQAQYGGREGALWRGGVHKDPAQRARPDQALRAGQRRAQGPLRRPHAPSRPAQRSGVLLPPKHKVQGGEERWWRGAGSARAQLAGVLLARDVASSSRLTARDTLHRALFPRVLYS
mmetsp:Transcript_4898/g.17766  ORF Transcript_4898/g.17766 Transcript_4898/m.17766 type:complete len:208 (+) Transcript_4898:514-1137(+)